MTAETDKKFRTGPLVMTRGVATWLQDNPKRTYWVTHCLGRHMAGDWGDLPEEDRRANEAVQIVDGAPEMRLMSSYNLPPDMESAERRLWIITDAEGYATTILFPSEY